MNFTKKLFLILLFCFINCICCLADKIKICTAYRTQTHPVIDGKIDEDVWQQNTNFFDGNFTQNQPDNGAISKQKTEIRILYNNKSIFIAARLYDNEPQKILKQFGSRDSRDQNSDYFGIAIDTYGNKRNAFMFLVSAAGVQTDYYITQNNNDYNWNAIWKSAVKIHDKGWDVELEIPYSSLRFPKKDEQKWGINFIRDIRRTRERSYWNHVDASKNGFVNQFGKLEGIKGIEPPVRLFFIPYATAYAKSDQVNKKNSTSLTGGMDIKYGINESFTLDMSLIPDFGQVRSDNVVLNLSPFEVFFAENRPFFTEGTELFNRNSLFYSRRVGKTFGEITLADNEEYVKAVNEAPLINATKISGRTKKGLGIGFFNAITNRTEAVIRNTETNEERSVTVDPVTNFNVVVVEKNLKNNSNIGFINTNVTRFGSYDANVSSLDFNLFDKSNTISIVGMGAFSQIYDKPDYLKNDVGYKYYAKVSKVSGAVNYGLSNLVESNNFNQNDLGFLRRNNKSNYSAFLRIKQFKPKKKILKSFYETGLSYNQLLQPNVFTYFEFYQDFGIRFNNFWTFGGTLTINPVSSYDYFESRTEGRYFRKGSWYRQSFWFNTDYRKALAVNIQGGFWQRKEFEQFDNWFSIKPVVRVSDKISFNHKISFAWRRKELGYVNKLYDENDNLTDIILGQRIVHNITNNFNLNFVFNPLMNITLRARHYWSNVNYLGYRALSEDGELLLTDYNGLADDGESLHNTNFNAFNIDMFYTWQFAPGSQIVLAWKNAISSSDKNIASNYTQNFNNTIQAPQTNSVSIRVLYFLDYLYLKKSK